MSYKKISTLLVGVFALVLLPVVGAQAQPNASGDEQRFIVTFKNKVDNNSKSAVHGAGAVVIGDIPVVNGMIVTVKDNAAAKKLAKIDGIKSVEKDALAYAYKKPVIVPTTPTQPAQQMPWGIDKIDADLAWGAGRGTGIKVAVIDTGIDKDHPDLINNIAGGVNYVATGKVRKVVYPSEWDDNNGHGTHVAGTIAAVNNTIGVVGVAPEARLYGVKVLDSTGSGYISDIILGIQWSIANNMDVINMSLGSSSDVQALHDAVDAAYNAGIVLVAAAGNSGDMNSATNEVGYPAKYSSVIAVAATDINNTVAYFSSDGAEVEISAPGYSVFSTTRGGGYGTMSGTSMASPHVAGAIAAALSANISSSADTDQNGLWSVSEVRAYLQLTSDDLGAVGRDVFYGYGLVDVEELVTGIQTQ